MKSRASRFPFFLGLFVVLLCCDVIEGQQPAPKPDSETQPGSKPANSQEAQKPDEPKPKTAIERETGTVNERIFEVMPNYGTVGHSKELPPLTSGQKFR